LPPKDLFFARGVTTSAKQSISELNQYDSQTGFSLANSPFSRLFSCGTSFALVDALMMQLNKLNNAANRDNRRSQVIQRD
jgi:hypothetical protein